MAFQSTANGSGSALSRLITPGMAVFVLATVAAAIYFDRGIDALLRAWQLPEYSHGPLIPVLSGLLFLRQLKDVPADPGVKHDRWPGVAVLVLALALGAVGKLSGIDDIVAYGLIVWVAAMLLISFGWRTGILFWAGVVHLVYMLPLPDTLYYKMSAWLQLVSSEMGVGMLRVIDVPVFLEGNIIDLGVLKLHVAEACSGLRYLFPIMSFSYVFACLYRGPIWHKAVLLLAAVPITVVMNSVRIAFGGWIANRFGLEYLEGFTHFFEGWVIFLICVILLFILAWLMMRIDNRHQSLSDALDLDMSGLAAQFGRLRLLRASPAMITGVVLIAAGALAFQLRPDADRLPPARDPFTFFPQQLGDWQSSAPLPLRADVARRLGADDYHSVQLLPEGGGSVPVELFMAYYEDQSRGGVHSPEICLPGSGWEIAWLERIDIAPEVGFEGSFPLNRAVIQKNQERMMVYYWFEQHGRRTAWDLAAKMLLLWDGMTIGRTDGGIVRLITPIAPDETDAEAEARLQDVFLDTVAVLPDYIPGG
ncbi:VPLPA-CTERM-specific exosortase XrtD [Jannaschia sp. W003]|uniref:VPLPA-CTERM-specific exosortase XrtD n=1 Tax=Jannaschia sp. W003 TaxID=2867012 RepID=UPI0021A7F51C|nr:VPLPA-CTERM-specific exosortase XrtD [Jannaschia sp. W003]UWQ23216.1 VPLPA-CTERM-specific exosortase XrtD [Jannaschia sp. W003]